MSEAPDLVSTGHWDLDGEVLGPRDALGRLAEPLDRSDDAAGDPPAEHRRDTDSSESDEREAQLERGEHRIGLFEAATDLERAALVPADGQDAEVVTVDRDGPVAGLAAVVCDGAIRAVDGEGRSAADALLDLAVLAHDLRGRGRLEDSRQRAHRAALSGRAGRPLIIVVIPRPRARYTVDVVGARQERLVDARLQLIRRREVRTECGDHADQQRDQREARGDAPPQAHVGGGRTT